MDDGPVHRDYDPWGTGGGIPEARTTTPDTRTVLEVVAQAWWLTPPGSSPEAAATSILDALAAAGARVVYGDIPNGATLDRVTAMTIKTNVGNSTPLYRVREEPTDG